MGSKKKRFERIPKQTQKYEYSERAIVLDFFVKNFDKKRR